MEGTLRLIVNHTELDWIDITEDPSRDCHHQIPFATVEKAMIREGMVIRHRYSHVMYFMEVYEFRLHSDLHAGYLVDESSLFLLAMLSGKISFSMPNLHMIRTAKTGTIYATRNEPGKFLFDMPADEETQCLCNFTIRPTWLTKEINQYIGIGPFLKKMEAEAILALYSYMPACTMSKKIKTYLQTLFSLTKPTRDDLEMAQLWIMKEVIIEYQKLAMVKLSHPVYRARDYLELNYADPDLNNEKLIKSFNVTKRTLIRNFKSEFNTTPHLYLTGVRMQHAYRLVMVERKTLNEVYISVGYRDLHSFSIQFKKNFNFLPPSYH